MRILIGDVAIGDHGKNVWERLRKLHYFQLPGQWQCK